MVRYEGGRRSIQLCIHHCSGVCGLHPPTRKLLVQMNCKLTKAINMALYWSLGTNTEPEFDLMIFNNVKKKKNLMWSQEIYFFNNLFILKSLQIHRK